MHQPGPLGDTTASSHEIAKLVSVVVPVHNVEDYLHRCVASVLGQTHTNLEVILVDDGSTDSSGAICEGYSPDPRVLVIHQENAGLSVARNTGLASARGDYITFVDSDDWIDTNFVESLLALLHRHDADVAACPLFRTSEPSAVPPPSDSAVSVLDREEALRALNGVLHTTLTVACGKVFSAGVLEGVRFPPGRLHEDEFTTYRALAAASRVVVAPRAMYHYWQRPDSITGVAQTRRNWRDVVDAYTERLAFLEAHSSQETAALGRQELYRKLLHYRHWLSPEEADERRTVDGAMKALLPGIRGQGLSWKFRLFAECYVRAPRLIGAVYQPYLNHARSRAANP